MKELVEYMAQALVDDAEQVSVIGEVQKPTYMPLPCQRWWAFIGETLTRPGCTQGRW